MLGVIGGGLWRLPPFLAPVRVESLLLRSGDLSCDPGGGQLDQREEQGTEKPRCWRAHAHSYRNHQEVVWKTGTVINQELKSPKRAADNRSKEDGYQLLSVG